MFVQSLLLASVASFASAATYDVQVGGLEGEQPILKFNPPFVNAVAGDQVVFHFQQKNHSVVQTSFDGVCHPLLNDAYQPVFQTQFFPVSNDETNFPTFTYDVTDASRPLWFYCGQKTHCGKGMIFAINCPTEGPNSLAAFEERALAIGAQEAAMSSSAAAWSATATPDVYGSQTYPAVWHPTVTETVTLGSDVWTTTYESYANSPDPTPATPEGVVHTVLVGNNGGLTYEPPSIQADVRDTVRFVFLTKNHTITQSSFGDPCRKLEFTSTTGQVGFDSGFVPGKDDQSAFFEIKVNDTAPIWAYCRQGNHCGQGMVFSINADEASDRSFDAFQRLAQTINGTGAPAPSQTGEVSGNAAFASASIVGGVAGLVLIGFGSFAALLL